MKKVSGKFETEYESVIYLYSDNILYTLSSNSKYWCCVRVGETNNCGGELTQKIYDYWEEKCDKTGTFLLYGGPNEGTNWKRLS